MILERESCWKMAIMPKVYSDEFKRDAVAIVEFRLAQKQVYKESCVSKTGLDPQSWTRCRLGYAESFRVLCRFWAGIGSLLRVP